MEVVLYNPEIPQNAGNIARTCAVTRTRLVLVEPLGFSLSERHLKRAGLDYWESLDMQLIDSLDLLLDSDVPFYLLSTKGRRSYCDVTYHGDERLIFGPESRGLPEEILERYPDRVVTLPMAAGERSLNLAVAVGVALYEALRQTEFRQLAI
jgi:tRNA (cytidine/uridine-2'-O-)-methyltransferase